jgi:hypothetical protein
MTQPTAPPPPPPTGPTPTVNARQQVEGPAIGLIITGAVGILLGAGSLLLNLVGIGASGLSSELGDYGDYDRYASFASSGMGIFFAFIGLCVSAFVIWAALKMKNLENRTLAVVASIVAMIPCLGPCCLIGLPIGIWSLVVLMKPEVQQAFVS